MPKYSDLYLLSIHYSVEDGDDGGEKTGDIGSYLGLVGDSSGRE